MEVQHIPKKNDHEPNDNSRSKWKHVKVHTAKMVYYMLENHITKIRA